MPVAFVTGGTGFLGLNLIEQLLAQSWEVIALHRPTSNLKHLREKDIQLVEGSITEPNFLITQQRIDEETHSNAIHSPINYHRTKYLAEMEVQKGIAKGLDALIINPTKCFVIRRKRKTNWIIIWYH